MGHRAVIVCSAATFLLVATGRHLGGPDMDPAFAFDFPAAVAIPSAVLGFGLVLLLALRPAAATAVLQRLTAAAGAIPPRLRLPLVIAGFTALCLLLPARRLSGDAGAVLHRAAVGEVYASNALTDFLTLALVRLSGIEPARAVMALSVFAGACFACFAAGLARECGRDAAGRAGLLALLLTCGTALLFAGHLEVYAASAAAMTAYLWLAARRVHGKDRGFAAPLVLGIAFALHGAAGLLLPTLLFLAPGARPRPAAAIGRGLLFLIPAVATWGALHLLVSAGVISPGPQRFGSFLGFLEQGPLLPLLPAASNLTTRYAILDADHLLGVLNLLLLAAPAGLPLALFAARGLFRAPFPRLATVAAIPFVLFPLFWNVGFPLRYDWDLFASAGVPLTLLGATAFLGSRDDRQCLPALVVLSLATFVPRLVTEHGDSGTARDSARVVADVYRALADRDNGRWREAAERWDLRCRELDVAGSEAGHRRALAALDEGRVEEAERLCRSVLAREPDHHGALVTLGMALRAQERKAEARTVLHRAVRTDPRDLRPRWLLSGIALEEGRTAEAIDLLERGVRAGGLNPSVPEVLRLLALLHEHKGNAKRAAALRDLLDRRLRVVSGGR